MMRTIFFILTICSLMLFVSVQDSSAVCGSPGKDGVMLSTYSSDIVNAYYPGLGDPAAGSSSLSVGAVNTSSGGQNRQIDAGDLVLIIQMQDADINATNSDSYGGTVSGSGYTALNSAGLYEYAVASQTVTTAGGTLNLSSPLQNSYRTRVYDGTHGASRYQVIRVPQFSSAKLQFNLTAPYWLSANAVGGVVAIDVAGELDWNGYKIDVAGRGFRGGGGLTLTGGAGANTDYRTLSSVKNNAQKGEGVAGTSNKVVISTGGVIPTGSEGYPNGSHARGAPGNAGGGGTDGLPASNSQNSGGGGGAGYGGGGKGGNAWSSAATSGGFGGSGIPMASNLLTMGGGGGAGTTNNGTGTPSGGAASSGATGGGVVFVRAGSVKGAGVIDANGNDANSTVCNDGSGGGGGGGGVMVVSATGSVGTLTVNANGGNGGSNLQAGCGTTHTAHGPGGGGGGGYVATSGSATAIVNGGANGITVGSVAYGATSGTAGNSTTALNASTVVGAGFTSACFPQVTVTKATSTPTAVKGGTATYTITATNSATAGWLSGLKLYDYFASPPNPPYPPGTPFAPFTFSSTTGAPTLSGGATRPTTTNPAAASTQPVWGDFSIPPGGSVALTFVANVPAATPYGLYQNNAAVFYNDPTRTVATQTVSPGGVYAGGGTAGGNNYLPTSTTNEDVAIWAPSPTINKGFSPQNVRTGATYSANMTFTISNSSGIPLSNVNFTDTLTGFKVKGTTIGGTCVDVTSSPPLATDATTLNLTIPSLPTTGCTITIPVYSSVAGDYTNTTSGAASLESGPISNGTPSNTATISFFDPLTVTKMPSLYSATPGAVVTYTIGYANPNSVASAILKELIITDPIPAYSTYQSASCGPLPANITSCTPTYTPPPAGDGNGLVTWTLVGDLNPGSSGTVQLSVTIN